MNTSAVTNEAQLYWPARCLAGLFAFLLVVLGVAAWQATKKLATMYHDLNITGTTYNAVFSVIGTPATLVVFSVAAFVVIIAARKASLIKLGWLNFMVAVGSISIFVGLLVFFASAMAYPATTMAR